MDKKDFSQWEEEMKEKVEKSMDAIHFDRLEKNIENAVNKTMEQAIKEIKKAWNHKEYVKNRMDEIEKKSEQKIKTGKQRKTHTNRHSYRQSTYRSNRPYEKKTHMPTFPVAKTPNGTISGVLYEFFGGIGVFFFGLGFLIYFLRIFTIGTDITTLSVALVLTLFFGFFFCSGIQKRKRVKRFKKYVKIMDGKCHYPVEKLASYVGRKKEFIVKDLTKMTELGMFLEGHFDETKTDFILDHKTYELYLETMEVKKKREQEELEARKEVASTQDKEENVLESENVEKVLVQGNIYIKKIRECNDKIADDIVSRKLYHLENITNKIFEHIKKYPNKVDKIEKFMDYYLPTSLKLVTTYQELDAQPVTGENIKRTKKEIEETLDTINTAFEKLLDSLFEEEMFDISSDISVLETVLKQEGLTESDFILAESDVIVEKK